MPTTEDTKKWKRARETVARDSSPLPESVPTPYKRLRAPDERTMNCARLRAHHDRTSPRQIKRRDSNDRKTKTKVPITDEDINKLFFERDILLDKLARRNDEIDMLRQDM